jgi:hypothetical protein
MYTIRPAHKRRCTIPLPARLSTQRYRVTTRRYLRTGRLVLERRIPCKSLYEGARRAIHTNPFLIYHREGFNREGGIEARGIIPRAIEQIFGHIQKYASPRMRFLVRASYLQIYNEQVGPIFARLCSSIMLLQTTSIVSQTYAYQGSLLVLHVCHVL